MRVLHICARSSLAASAVRKRQGHCHPLRSDPRGSDKGTQQNHHKRCARKSRGDHHIRIDHVVAWNTEIADRATALMERDDAIRSRPG